MLTHRSCWASPSFCRHWCLSASQWSSSQRNCRGNSDRRGGERRRTTSRFSCRNSLKTTAKFISRLSDNSGPARIIRYTEAGSEFSYLQHWQSVAEYFCRVYDVVGGFNPVLGVLPQICKLLQGGIGLDKDRTRTRTCEMAGYQQDFITCCVCVCVAVWVCVGSSILKTKSNLLKIEPQ